MIRTVVAHRDDPPRLIRLADVLITPPDGVQARELFAEFGGLALILVAGPGRRVAVGTRDGAVVPLLLDPGWSVGLVAVVVHQGWVVAKNARPR